MSKRHRMFLLVHLISCGKAHGVGYDFSFLAPKRLQPEHESKGFKRAAMAPEWSAGQWGVVQLCYSSERPCQPSFAISAA